MPPHQPPLCLAVQLLAPSIVPHQPLLCSFHTSLTAYLLPCVCLLLPAAGAMLSEYEKQRDRAIAANMEVLKSLGLGGGGHLLPTKHQKQKKQPVKRKAVAKQAESGPANGEDLGPRRKSPRLRDGASECDSPAREVNDDYEARTTKVEKPPDLFGELPDFPVGSGWETRADCCADLVHRATVAGIVGTPESGCYSIVLNGGYADDVDRGELLTYTGSGGRSLKGTAANPKNLRSGPATHDQTLDGKEGRYNAALFKSSESGQPVRVVRGYKLVDSKWAPLGIDYGGEVNYRYDGLYKVCLTQCTHLHCVLMCHRSHTQRRTSTALCTGGEGVAGARPRGLQGVEVRAQAAAGAAGAAGRGGSGRGRG